MYQTLMGDRDRNHSYLEYFGLNLLLLSSVPASNGGPPSEKDEDEDEQGEKFEFDDSDDGDDNKPTEMSFGSETKTGRTPASNSVQETVKEGTDGTTSPEQKVQTSSVNQQDCSGKTTTG